MHRLLTSLFRRVLPDRAAEVPRSPEKLAGDPGRAREILAPYRDRFFVALVAKDATGALAEVDAALESGAPPEAVLLDVVSGAMDEIGEMQANREITLSEIYVVARIGDAAIERIVREMPRTPPSAGTVIIGTVRGDHHGLGRKIVASFLRVARFRVVDLGTNVASARFVDAAVEHDAPVICASALLLHTAFTVREIRQIIDDRGLTDRIRLVAGGAAFNFDALLYRTVGADATAKNATSAVTVVRELVAAARGEGR